MTGIRFDLRHLAYAVALAEAGSFGRAAEELGIAQSTLSRSIQTLEARVGGLLFDRLPRGVEATSLGLSLLDGARPILHSARELDRELAATLGLETGHLQVVVGPYVDAVLLGPALARFLSQAPGVRVRIDPAGTLRVAQMLNDGEADVAIADSVAFSDHPELVGQPLRPRYGEYYCRTGHPILERETVELADILEYPLATPHIKAAAWERLTRGVALDAGPESLAASAPQIQSESLPGLSDLVESSDAIGIFTPGIVRRQLKEGTLIAIPLAEPKPNVTWWMVTREGRTPSPAATVFMDAIRWADEQAVPY